MSAIDCFEYDMIGDFGTQLGLPVYRLTGGDLDRARREYGAKVEMGDVLIGGGSGEHAAFIIHVRLLELYILSLDIGSKLHPDTPNFHHETFTSHWGMNDAIRAGAKLGIDGFCLHETSLEAFLVDSVIDHLLRIHDAYPVLSDEVRENIAADPEFFSTTIVINNPIHFSDDVPFISIYKNLATGHVMRLPAYPSTAAGMIHPWAAQ